MIAPDLRTAPVPQRLQYDYGAVLRYTALWFEDHGPDISIPFLYPLDFQASRAVHDWELRPWLSVSLDGVHFGYVRGQFDFLQYHSGDSYYRNSDWRGPFVDLGFYRLDVDEALRRYRSLTVERWAADLTLGRQFLYLGRGISFALVTDAGSLDWRCGPWAGLLFGSQSIHHYDNIDRSVPGYTWSDREFFGAQIEYQGLDHHQPYWYVLVQRDRSAEVPENRFQEFDYDSEYWGVGVRGEAMWGAAERAVGVQNLEYFGELILERGRSFGVGATDSQDPIRSWAADAGLIYYGRGRTRPRLMLEYARASGDPERRTPQDTLLGNQAGTVDRGFLAFGYLNTGVSFAPLLANLELLRLAAACRPFEQQCRWRVSDLEVGGSWFVYWRPGAEAGVSDLRADLPGDHFLGHELDLFLNWRLSSDLYLLANYGVFWPHHHSFSVDRSRQFLAVSLAWLL